MSVCVYMVKHPIDQTIRGGVGGNGRYLDLNESFLVNLAIYQPIYLKLTTWIDEDYHPLLALLRNLTSINMSCSIVLNLNCYLHGQNARKTNMSQRGADMAVQNEPEQCVRTAPRLRMLVFRAFCPCI